MALSRNFGTRYTHGPAVVVLRRVLVGSGPLYFWVVVGGSAVKVVVAPSSFLFLVVRPGAPSSVLAPSRDARSP